jgi:hypothetical protein
LDQTHYLALGCVLIGLGGASLATGRLQEQPTISAMPFLLFSAATVVAGLLDHLVLVRVMRQLAPEPGAVAGAAIEEGEAVESGEVQR